jgi:hypothetical protein
VFGLSGKTPFTKEISVGKHGNDALLSLCGNHGQPDSALFDEEYGVRRIALLEDAMALPKLGE